jgi:hypothetical protein
LQYHPNGLSKCRVVYTSEKLCLLRFYAVDRSIFLCRLYAVTDKKLHTLRGYVVRGNNIREVMEGIRSRLKAMRGH